MADFLHLNLAVDLFSAYILTGPYNAGLRQQGLPYANFFDCRGCHPCDCSLLAAVN